MLEALDGVLSLCVHDCWKYLPPNEVLADHANLPLHMHLHDDDDHPQIRALTLQVVHLVAANGIGWLDRLHPWLSNVRMWHMVA